MKARTMILIGIFLLSATFLFAGGKDKISKREFWRTISGTWLNTDYLGTYRFAEQKLIIYPDGKHEYYPMTTDTVPTRKGYFLTVDEVWLDSDGTIWYNGIREEHPVTYELGRISESGNTWEYIGDGIVTPTDWDTSRTRYEINEIRYRQE